LFLPDPGDASATSILTSTLLSVNEPENVFFVLFPMRDGVWFLLCVCWIHFQVRRLRELVLTPSVLKLLAVLLLLPRLFFW
jgi:hypothetical protein